MDELEGEVQYGGLEFGITPFLLRILTDNPWDGGAGYSINDVAKMTPDQIYFRLCDKKLLSKESSGRRVMKVPPSALRPDKDGMVPGVAEDGTPIRIPLPQVAKSLNRRHGN